MIFFALVLLLLLLLFFFFLLWFFDFTSSPIGLIPVEAYVSGCGVEGGGREVVCLSAWIENSIIIKRNFDPETQ